MRTAEIPPPRDPEFDRPQRPTSREPGRDVVRYYQRLFVNPFLGVIALAVAFAVAGVLGGTSRPDLASPARVVGFLLAILVLQYHCLDCGTTGSYHRWRCHACPRVIQRWNTPFASASRIFPTPTTQLALWLFVFALAFFLAAAS